MKKYSSLCRAGRWGFFCALLLGIAACGKQQYSFDPTPPGPAWLSEPRSIQMEFVVTVTVEDVLAGEALAEENRKAGLPENLPPHLMFWSADLQNHFGQQDVRLLECEPAPTAIGLDPENGNRILHWDFSKRLKPGAEFTLRRLYCMTLHKFDPGIETADVVGAYDPADPIVRFYTKSEPFLEQTDAIRAAARQAVGIETHSWEKTLRIYRWVRNHMTYKYPPPGGRGATIALRERQGDCGQYADLFIALCRCEGIPARFVGGFSLKENQQTGQLTVGSHVWAEVRLPDGRWIPMDPTHEEEKFFGKCPVNTYVGASIGRNILLPEAPEWATYQCSDVENGRTEFMQTLSEVRNGVKATVNIQRRVLP